MPSVTNDGVQINYEIEGSGIPLVLAHGIGASLQDWEETGWVSALKDSYQLILVDARGHGRSDKPHDPAAYAQIHQAMDHTAVLDALGIGKAHFLGFSMGGLVSLGAAIYAPERCLSFMIGGTQPYARGNRPSLENLPKPIPLRGLPEVDNPINHLLLDGGEAWANFFEANIDVSPAQRERLIANDMEALRIRFATLHPKDLSRHLASVRAPGLIYVGEDEFAYGGAKHLADQLPTAEFYAFPGLNHFEMLTEPDVVIPKILSFLERIA